MRIKKIKAESFGHFKNWESPELDGNLVVFHGPNESGKSTLFNLVSTLLYGWSPASRENNPYVPWDGFQASCAGEIIDRQGREITVYRKLKGRPEGIAAMGSKSIQIGNNAIWLAEKMPREIFTEIYALTLDELCMPNTRVWLKMQDQLLGGQFNSFLYPVGDVIKDLENEANSLWRRDRRGNPKVKELKKILLDLKEKHKKAFENERKLHETERKLDELNMEMHQMLEQKAKLAAYIDKYERLNPIRKKLNIIKEMEYKAGNIAQFEHLPQDISKTLSDMESRKNELIQKRNVYKIQKEKLQGQIALLTLSDKSIIASRDAIREVSKAYSQIELDVQSQIDIENEISGYKKQISDRARDFISGGWREEYESILEGVDEAGLRAAIEQYRKHNNTYEQYNVIYSGLKTKRLPSKSAKMLSEIGVLFAAVGIIGFAAFGFKPLGFILGLAGVLGVSLIIMGFLPKDKRANAQELRTAASTLKELEVKVRNARDGIKQLLNGLPVSEIMLQNPGEILLLDVIRLKDLIQSASMCLNKKHDIEKRIIAKKKEVEKICDNLDICHDHDILRNISMLDKSLKEAEEHYKIAQDAKARMDEVNNYIEEITQEIKNIDDGLQKVLIDLDRLQGGSIDEKIDNLRQRRSAKAKSEMLREELERNYINIDEAIEEIVRAENEGEKWVFDDESAARAKIEQKQLDIEINDINEEIGSLKESLKYMLSMERLDDIEGQIEYVEAEIKNAKVKRDRFELLKNILVEADMLFREEHQPDVLKKAGKYLDVITGGRYNMLFINDENSRTLSVKSSTDNYPIELSKPLSRGTKEQIYLALRLALIDHLDSNEEKFPIFLDEALVNWDNLRLDNLINILDEITSNRQVFVFTCHDFMIERLSSVKSLQVVKLQ